MSTLPVYSDALERALKIVSPITDTDEVALAESSGRVLAESIIADRDLPPFNRAQMDGYALRAAELGKVDTFNVVATIPAGNDADVTVPVGSCVAIATGAPLPDDVDTVIQHENSDRSNPVRFSVDSIEPSHAVHLRGSDAKTGDELIKPRTILAAHHLGIAAIVGCARIRVIRQPRITVLSSGDELKSIEESIQPYQIRNSNGPMIAELLSRIGGHVIRANCIADDLEATQTAVTSAIATSDLLITIGGISAGERDYFPAAFETCDVEMVLRGATIQPGKPINIGLAPGGCIIAGLPGNPVSALVCACLFVQPILRTMLGLDSHLPWRRLKLSRTVKPNPRRQAFRPAILNDYDTVAVPTWSGSGDLVHTAETHGIVELPVQTKPVEAGSTVRFLPWP